MADRQVTHSGKDRDGDITSLCGPGWGKVSKAKAIPEIENAVNAYYVAAVQPAVWVHVVTEGYLKYLRTTADNTSKNNLDNLPNC
jgi:hypothetical protein